MNKAFTNFTWVDEPNYSTPLSAENLNKINNALDTVDSRVVDMSNIPICSNRNLLDNPWFTVNQRGERTYITNSYTVDRWKLSSLTETGTSTLYIQNNGGASITAEEVALFTQKIPRAELPIGGMQVTASVLYNGSGLKYGTVTLPTFSSTETTIDVFTESYHKCYITIDANYITFGIRVEPMHSLHLRALKLELGAVSTLSNDTFPNYTEELTKCQRYFVSLTGTQYHNSFPAYAYSTTEGEAWAYLPTTMISSTPTVDRSQIWSFVPNISPVRFTGAYVAGNKCQIYFTTNGGGNFTTGAGYIDNQNSGDSTLTLSAEP